jgi:formylglycine-generating enzyme
MPIERGLTAMIRVEGGTFTMGSTEFYPDEGPAVRTRVDTFEIDAHPVTNEQFTAFVDATGYVTVAERPLKPADYPGVAAEDLLPGALVFKPTAGPVDLGDWRNWWTWQPGASWRHPFGADSSIDDMRRHPVVHVAFDDVNAYASWVGKRLPTEAEWEYACRGGHEGRIYAWGNEPRLDDRLMANSWQGRFPYLNTGADGWIGTSPVGSFEPNDFGIVDMIGNVWEWTSDYYTAGHDAMEHDVAASDSNPSGDGTGCMCSPQDGRATGLAQASALTQAKAAASAEPGSVIPRRVLKGGSHLCAPEYCLRFRPAARSPQAEDTATTHIGFRLARSV